MFLWLASATAWFLVASCPQPAQGQSGNAFVEAIVSHLRITPFLVRTLNVTSYPHSFNVQEDVELVNVGLTDMKPI